MPGGIMTAIIAEQAVIAAEKIVGIIKKIEKGFTIPPVK